MPLFSRFKSKGAQSTKGKNGAEAGDGSLLQAQQARWQSRWESPVIVPEEVKELIHVCTAEMKTRAEALDAPFFLLPFRPDSDPQGARIFIRNFYKSNAERSSQYTGEGLKQELRLTDSVVVCSILKWCWSRMPEGVVSWPVYDSFRIGEKEAREARNAFNTFIPIGADSEARQSIIVDFYDLLAAVAAHGKMNGLTGRKVSRMAGWWAFEHSDDGNGFEGGYKSWTSAADASSHLFFAYLRSLSPDTDPSMNVIERIPRSLQALMASTEYPPETPTLLQRTTTRVVMVVDSVSPTPFALLRRAKNFEYRDQDLVLREFAEFEDPIDALTEECKRVLYAVSSANQSKSARSRKGLEKSEESWSAFSNIGFADLDEKAFLQKSPASITGSTQNGGQGLRDQPASRSADAGRPTTPSWADFLSSGFAEDAPDKSPALLYPPAHVLPPLGGRLSSPAQMVVDDEDLAPGELAAITDVDLDDAFWWVWMTSLAGEEPPSRKAVFGRCALIETTIMKGRWLIMEEQVKGASPDPAQDAYIAPKKSFFGFTKRGKLGRKRSTSKTSAQQPLERTLSATPSKTSISIDQHAKIRAAARALTTKQESTIPESVRRNGNDESLAAKNNSTLPVALQSAAGPAMKWASSYDKSSTRAQYLGDAYAGKGASREDLRRTSSNNLKAAQPVTPVSTAQPHASTEQTASIERDAPSVLKDEYKPASAPVPVTTAAASEPPAASVPDEPEPTAEFTEPILDGDFAQFSSADAPPPELARPASAIADKEIAVESPTTPKRIGRKPVSSPYDHPAFRAPTKEEITQAESPPPNPAALAAQRAMSSIASTSPDNKYKRQNGAGAGIKKLFGKKKDAGARDSSEATRPAANGLAPPNESGIGRRLSLMRKKPVSSNSQHYSESAMAARAAAETHTHEPIVRDVQAHQDYSTVPLSRTSSGEREAAEKEFSTFDQGPLEDTTNGGPVDFQNESSRQNDKHEYSNLAVSRTRPQASAEPKLEPSSPEVSDTESEATMEDHHDTGIVQDRWANIRENAHKRVAEKRASEEQSTQSRPSQGARTDDGETSGEETIESRVARIKARVAELTGNMDSATRV